MKNKDYNSQIKELSAQIKANSKDAKFAEQLVKKLLSAKGQSMVEPTLVYIPQKDVEESWEGDTFRMCRVGTKAVYHVKGGFTLICESGFSSLYETIISAIRDQEKAKEYVGEEKERFELMMSVITYVLNTPMYAFTDEKFTFELATMLVKFLREKSEELLNQPLQEETPEEDAAFKDAVMSMEGLKEEIKKEK